ncbi:hypothetical protein HF325_001517 [Metschnikowia pulcherrima]|uniref:B-related factor 1 n=1 Tax=Metschnikowia pulcherrima TaxID=27326 RepID=A0A8H7GWZ3_9ASCO|nr:hypothetical protein HF325_001517 [Metschnikowia pulcherrima]
MSKVAAAKPCAGCGHTEFTRDFQATAGDVLCLLCGMVQIENPIVSEVQFGESSSGAATVQGAMVGADQARVYNMRNSLESREQTLMNAKQKIRLLASSMRIPDYIHESACGWFKLALVQNFVQGRRSQNVIAACLYVACRHERTPHLLIDFSSRLQISVYSLGATYLKLVRALQIQRLPLADPSLFIQHFAERLNFQEHTAKICRDATKIAQRMSSDWIYEGRRPAGIAGACLLLAARMNNFRRSHAEIVAVAKVGEETLQKRLNEFKKTSSALLSVLAFRDSSNTNDSKPPSYHKNRAIELKIEKLLRQRSHTLKKYQELAKKRELFKHLKLDEPESPENESTPASPQKEATADHSEGPVTESHNGETNAEAGKDESQSIQTLPTENANVSDKVSETDALSANAEDDQASPKKAQPESEITSEVQREKESEIQSDAEVLTSTKDVESQKSPELAAQPDEVPVTKTNLPETQDTSSERAQEKPEQPTEASEKLSETDDEDEVNELFVPESDEDDLGYDALPDNSDQADEDYDQVHSKIVATRRNLRSSTNKSSETQLVSKSTRLGSISDSRASGRRGRNSSKQTAPLRKKKDEAKLKELNEKKKKEELDAREDELLKAVLRGGDIKEEDLEIALDKILQGQKKSLDSSLYRTPAELQNETDILKQIDLDRPRNLVVNNLTTRQILSRVRDDETINTDDEDEEVLNVKLTDEEKTQKERIWIALNHDFLIAQERKRLKIEADELTGNTSGQLRKRRKIKEADPLLDDGAVAQAIHLIGEGGRMISPAENAKQMLQKKSFSRKINYNSIGELFNE